MSLSDQTNDTERGRIEMIVLVTLAAAFVVVSLVRQHPWNVGWDKLSGAIGVIIAGGLTLVMYSFLYRDNPLFKIAENLYVGTALGYGMVITWRQSLRPEVYDPLFLSPTADVFLSELAARCVPITLGLLLLTRLSRKYSWLSRYSYGPMVGWGAGVGIVAVTNTMVLRQLDAAIRPLQAGVAAGPFDSFWAWFGAVVLPVTGAIVLLIGTVTVLFYFFFSIQHKRAGGAISRVGVWFLMISFGASFGYTVMGRLSLLIGRVRFLLFDWLHLSP